MPRVVACCCCCCWCRLLIWGSWTRQTESWLRSLRQWLSKEVGVYLCEMEAWCSLSTVLSELTVYLRGPVYPRAPLDWVTILWTYTCCQATPCCWYFQHCRVHAAQDQSNPSRHTWHPTQDQTDSIKNKSACWQLVELQFSVSHRSCTLNSSMLDCVVLVFIESYN